MNTKIIFKLSAGLVMVIFLIVAILFWNYAENRQKKIISEHGRVIARAVWECYAAENWQEYFQLASLAYHYSRVIVTQSNGEKILDLSQSMDDAKSRLLISIGLIPAKTMESKIFWHEEQIGTITITWYNTSIFGLSYGLLVALLIMMALWLFLRNVGAKQELEIRVEERTKDLRKEIAEHRCTEAALQKSEELFRDFVEGTDNLITRVDLLGTICYVNHASNIIFGLSPEACIGLFAFDFIDTRDRKRTEKWFADCLANQVSSASIENRQVSASGVTRDMIWTVNFHYDEQGKGTHINSIARDITEQKRHAQILSTRLRLSEFSISHSASEFLQKFLGEAELLTASEVAVFAFIDPRGQKILKQIWSDKTVERLQVTGNNLFHDKVSAAGDWIDCIREQRPVIRNCHQNPSSGRSRPDGPASQIRELVAPIFHENKIVAVIGMGAKKTDYTDRDIQTLGEIATTAWDIYLRKKAEEEVKQGQSRLIKAQKMEAIGTLAAGIAHDFNNILFPLVGYAEILKGDLPADHHFQRPVNVILNSALRARALVQQILSFSSETTSEVKPIKLQGIVKEALQLLRASIPTTIEISQTIDSKCGVVNADANKFHQIIMNLATNAYHAMEGTCGKLTVKLKQVALGLDSSTKIDLLPGQFARLTVADTGHGIGKEIIDKVFDPYFTTKETGKGTGLGLSIVHGIVKEFGGAIHVESRPGKGTKMQVFIPILESEEMMGFADAAAVPGGTERILLVDDEETIVSMGKELLERLGYQTTVHTESMKALDAFRTAPDMFDLIITDIAMPKISGIQLAQEIKKIKSTVPILLCTGYKDQLSDEKCQAMGIHGYLLKPVIRKELAEAIRKALDSNRFAG